MHNKSKMNKVIIKYIDYKKIALGEKSGLLDHFDVD